MSCVHVLPETANSHVTDWLSGLEAAHSDTAPAVEARIRHDHQCLICCLSVSTCCTFLASSSVPQSAPELPPSGSSWPAHPCTACTCCFSSLMLAPSIKSTYLLLFDLAWVAQSCILPLLPQGNRALVSAAYSQTP